MSNNKKKDEWRIQKYILSGSKTEYTKYIIIQNINIKKNVLNNLSIKFTNHIYNIVLLLALSEKTKKIRSLIYLYIKKN